MHFDFAQELRNYDSRYFYKPAFDDFLKSISIFLHTKYHSLSCVKDDSAVLPDTSLLKEYNIILNLFVL